MEQARPDPHYNRRDVTGRIDLFDPGAVLAEIVPITARLYGADAGPLPRAIEDLGRLFRGEFDGYHACETPYHNLSHSLDTALAMARMLDGHEQAVPKARQLGPELFRVGVIAALYHDAGYIRSRNDHRRSHGAQYTMTHVRRSADFLGRYLPGIRMGRFVQLTRRVVHFTAHKTPLTGLRGSSGAERLLGCMLASSDVLAQMADRSYLEKCRDQLFPEFVIAGIASMRVDGREAAVYASGIDLLQKTPAFMRLMRERLDTSLEGVHQYLKVHFGGAHPYLESLQRNLDTVQALIAQGDPALLQRSPLRLDASPA